MRKNNKKGFTIVELVIVIAVIAILAGVLIPVFSGVINNANKSAAMQEMTTEYKSYIGQPDVAKALTGTESFIIVQKKGSDYYAMLVANTVIGGDYVGKGNSETNAISDMNAVVKGKKIGSKTVGTTGASKSGSDLTASMKSGEHNADIYIYKATVTLS